MDHFTYRGASNDDTCKRAAQVLVDGNRDMIVRRWVADEALAVGETVS